MSAEESQSDLVNYRELVEIAEDMAEKSRDLMEAASYIDYYIDYMRDDPRMIKKLIESNPNIENRMNYMNNFLDEMLSSFTGFSNAIREIIFEENFGGRINGDETDRGE